MVVLVGFAYWLVLSPGDLSRLRGITELTGTGDARDSGQDAEADQPGDREQRLRRVFGSLWDDPPQVQVEETEITISAPDGSVTLSIQTPEIASEGDRFILREAVVRVSDVEGAHLELNATRTEMAIGSNELTIEGSLNGAIPDKGQTFRAERLLWDQTGRELLMQGVTLDDPAFHAEGGELRLTVGEERMELSGGITLDF